MLDVDAHQAAVGPAELDLTHKEFQLQLLLLLARNAGRLLSHGRLLARAWEGAASLNTLRIHVSGLRRKLDESGSTVHIESEPGVGYRLVIGTSDTQA